MRSRATALRIVPPPADTPGPGAAEARPSGSRAGDLLLLVLLLTASLVPIVGNLAGGRWSDRAVGAATAIAVLLGIQLVRELRRTPGAR
jgi:hypothetical protein